MARPSISRSVSCVLLVLSMGACTGDDTSDNSQCVENLALNCSPAYSPTYDAIFDDVLEQRCAGATTGGACHYGPTAALAQAGLVLSDRTAAYDYLLGHIDGRARVIAGDPQCSILVERLESTDANFRMPIGNDPLPESRRCAVRQWIANGAVR